jgi:hypothetical protein
MQRRTLVLAALAAVTAIIPRPLAAAPTPRAGHRRRRHRGARAAADASASVTGPNGGTSVAVTCNDEHAAETDPTAAQVACQD